MPNSTTIIPENQIVINAESTEQAIEINFDEDASAQYYAEQAKGYSDSAGDYAATAAASASSATTAAASAVSAASDAAASAGTASAASESAISARDAAIAAKDRAEAVVAEIPDIETTPTEGSSNLVTSGGVYTALTGKVDAQAGKGLSTNDYTTTEKNKLSGIETGAQVNTVTGVKGDSEGNYRTGNINITKANIGLGNVENTADMDKPVSTATQTALNNKVDKDGDKGLSTEDYTTAEKNKLAGIESGATRVIVDSELDELSGDAVENAVVTEAINALNADLANKADDSVVVKSVNSKTSTNGAVEITAEDIPADGIGDKSVSGNPITIEDGMASVAKGLSVTLEPVQDLHGYDHPWPEGGGKNLLDYEQYDTGHEYISMSAFENLVGTTVTISAQNNSSYNFFLKIASNATATPVWGSSLISASSSATESFTITQEMITLRLYAIETTNYGTLSASEFEKCKFQIEKGSSPTAWAPYSNICPIEGRTGTEVQRTGKNLLNHQIDGPYYSVNSDGSVSVSGTDGRAWSTCAPVPIKAGTYTFSCKMSPAAYADIRLSTENYEVTHAIYSNGTYTESATFTLAEDAYFKIKVGYSSSSYPVTAYPQIETGSTATSYEPYSKDTASVTFGQTVYGCTHDFVTGKCRVTKASVDMGTLSWSKQTHSGNRWTFIASSPSDSFATRVLSQDNLPFMSELFAGTASHPTDADVADGTITMNNQGTGSSKVIRVKWTKYTEATDFTTAVTGSKLVYELATPTELTLTPAQLTLLEGTNILTADGQINLTYLGSMASNVQDEIDEFENGLNNVIGSIAFIENSTAKTSHAVGEYVILNGIFCKVIASISAGETLSFGTNIQATTIGAELRVIWAEISA